MLLEKDAVQLHETLASKCFVRLAVALDIQRHKKLFAKHVQEKVDLIHLESLAEKVKLSTNRRAERAMDVVHNKITFFYISNAFSHFKKERNFCFDIVFLLPFP